MLPTRCVFRLTSDNQARQCIVGASRKISSLSLACVEVSPSQSQQSRGSAVDCWEIWPEATYGYDVMEHDITCGVYNWGNDSEYGEKINTISYVVC